MQIAELLDKLGLGQYAQRFAENDIDFPILGDLTDQDFEKIGISLGHHRKMLRAIADLEDIEKVAYPRSRLRRPPGNGRWTPPSAATSR